MTSPSSRHARADSPDQSVREALIEQLAYLCDELRMLAPMASALPQGLLEARRTEGSASLIEIYSSLLASTRDAVRALATGEVPERRDPAELTVPAGSDILNVIESLIVERERLVDQFKALPERAWTTGEIGLLVATELAVVDLELQRSAAELLAEWSPGQPR